MNQDEKRERNRERENFLADLEWRLEAAFDREAWRMRWEMDSAGVSVIDSAAELPFAPTESGRPDLVTS